MPQNPVNKRFNCLFVLACMCVDLFSATGELSSIVNNSWRCRTCKCCCFMLQTADSVPAVGGSSDDRAAASDGGSASAHSGPTGKHAPDQTFEDGSMLFTAESLAKVSFDDLTKK